MAVRHFPATIIRDSAGNTIHNFLTAAGESVLNELGLDMDFRYEADTNANAFRIDGGLNGGVGNVAFGGAPTADLIFLIGQPAITATANADFYRFAIDNPSAVTIPTGTAALVAAALFAEPNITATGTVTEASTVRISGAPTEGTRNYALFQDAAATSRFDGTIVITAGTNLTNPTGMTVGLFIEQAGNDDDAVQISSTDVAHGFTTIMPTGTYTRMLKGSPTDGGLQVDCATDGTATTTFLLRAIQTAAMSSTRSTAGRGTIEFYGTVGSGTDVGNATADGNVVAVRTRAAGADVTRFILDSDGDSHQDVGTAWTNFDAYDDVALLNTLANEVARQDDPIQEEFHSFINYNRAALEKAGIVRFNEDGHHFVNMSRLSFLQTGAIRQLGLQISKIKEALLKSGAAPELLLDIN